MTPQEALALLDRVCSQVPLPRADHVRVLQAVQVLGDALGKPIAQAPTPTTRAEKRRAPKPLEAQETPPNGA